MLLLCCVFILVALTLKQDYFCALPSVCHKCKPCLKLEGLKANNCDRRRSQTIAEDRTMFYLLRSSAICCYLRTFAPKSSYGEIFFISPLELVHKVFTPKMKMGVTDFVSEKMAVEKCLNFDKSVIIKRCSLLC